MKLTPMTVLSESEIKQIHEASLDILEHCGVKIGSPRMLDFLEERGLPDPRRGHCPALAPYLL